MTENTSESSENKFFLKKFTEEFSNRIKSKLIFSYVFSWLIVNWKPLFYLLFSTASVEDKIKPTNHNLVFESLLPFIGVFIYVIVIPPLSILLTLIANWISKGLEIAKIKQELDLKDNELKLRQKYIENRNKYYDAIETEPLILRLEKQIEILENESNEKDIKINLYEESLAIDIFNSYDYQEKKEVKKIILSILSNDFQRVQKDSINEDNKLFFKLFNDGFLREGTQHYYLTGKGKILANRLISGELK